ncbi:MAG TPA: hypothetical protein VE359_15320 [Vicinamibacteria bacterium]|nr:hypothetical protein [Vicinamibacteria bacterium]
MRKAAFVLGLLGLLSPSALQAEGVAIDHRAVGCIVAGKYPRLNACFAPTSSLARARVYFRVADAPPDWYYVEMASDSPCHAGILPRPKKELVGRRIQYYLDAFDRSFAESRTPEAEALVVSHESECEKKLLAAPFLRSATVAVFPSVPAGFAGGAAGLGAGATAALAVGGAAVVGGGVALVTGGGSPSTPTTTQPPVGEVPTTTVPTTTTTTTTTTPASAFNPVFKVFDGLTLVPGDTIVGTEPLALRFDMCDSTGTLPMRFAVEVDGVIQRNGCYSGITFTTVSASTGSRGAAVRHSGATRTYSVRMTIQSIAPDNEPKAHRRLTVTVNSVTQPPTSGCSADTQGPVVTLAKPTGGSSYPTPLPYPVHLEASASDATTGNNGVAFVEYKINYPGPEQVILGPVTSGSPWPYGWTESAVNAYLGATCTKTLEVQAYAQDSCGNSTYSAKTQIAVTSTATFCDVATGPTASAAGATILSELGVPGGAGQVVANGEAAFPRAGRSSLAVRLEPRGNRVEGTLVEARSAGTWRFELGGVPGFRPESLRVVAGEVVQLAGDAVTFRLQGRPGERVVFVFRADRP